MARELDVQTKLIKSARRDGGYGRKLSHKFSIGIPDLLIGLPPFIPALAEVKDIGVVVDKFDKKLEVTEKQSLELHNFDAPYHNSQTRYTPSRHSALVLVALVHRGKHRLVACTMQGREKYDEPWRLDHTYEATPERWVEREAAGYYPMRRMFEWAGIALVRLM